MPETTLTDRAVLRLSGEDMRGFLQGLVTQDVMGELPVWAGLLTPQGKCLFDFFVWADGDDLLIDCEEQAAADLAKRLSLYRLRRAIVIERDLSLAVFWSAGCEQGVTDPRLAALGNRRLAKCAPAEAGAQVEFKEPADQHSELLPSATHNYREHRLRLGVCEGAAELSDLLWLECNAIELNGVSFTKGCFVGQENTARMNWRSKVNRRLVVVDGDGDGDGDGGDRARMDYPELGLVVVHARIDAIPASAIIPDWLAPSLRS